MRGAVLKDNIAGANAFFRLINQLTVLSAILLSLRSVPVLLSVSGCCLWVYHLRCHCHFPQASAVDFRQVTLKQGNLVLKNGRTCASSIFLRALSASSGRTPSFQVSTPAYPVAFLQVSEQAVSTAKNVTEYLASTGTFIQRFLLDSIGDSSDLNQLNTWLIPFRLRQKQDQTVQRFRATGSAFHNPAEHPGKKCPDGIPVFQIRTAAPASAATIRPTGLNRPR